MNIWYPISGKNSTISNSSPCVLSKIQRMVKAISSLIALA